MAKCKTSKRYTREFRQELVALHRAGRSIPELSREFGPHTLDDCVVGEAGRSRWRSRRRRADHQ